MPSGGEFYQFDGEFGKQEDHCARGEQKVEISGDNYCCQILQGTTVVGDVAGEKGWQMGLCLVFGRKGIVLNHNR